MSTATFYPQLREMLDDRFGEASDGQIESAFAEAFGEGVTPAEYEEFFGSLGKALGQFGKIAAPIAAAAGQGALTGSALGPYGALGGAILGGAGAALSQHGSGSARGVGNALSSVVGTAGALTGSGAPAGGSTAQAAGGLLGALGQRNPSAAGILSSLLSSPQAAQALGALAGGRNPALPVGPSGTPVPASAIAGLLSALAHEAESEAEGVGPDAPPMYLLGTDGRLVVDPAVPTQRAGRVLQLLAAGEAAEGEGADEGFGEGTWDEGAFDEGAFDEGFDESWADELEAFADGFADAGLR